MQSERAWLLTDHHAVELPQQGLGVLAQGLQGLKCLGFSALTATFRNSGSYGWTAFNCEDFVEWWGFGLQVESGQRFGAPGRET